MSEVVCLEINQDEYKKQQAQKEALIALLQSDTTVLEQVEMVEVEGEEVGVIISCRTNINVVVTGQ